MIAKLEKCPDCGVARKTKSECNKCRMKKLNRSPYKEVGLVRLKDGLKKMVGK